MKKYTEEELNKIKESFYDQIKKRDEIIDDLKKKNDLLLKTALKKAQTRIEQEELEQKNDKARIS